MARRLRAPALVGFAVVLPFVILELIRAVGFEPVDAGPLQTARYLEPFSLAIAQIAYEGDKGPEIAYRFERFGKS